MGQWAVYFFRCLWFGCISFAYDKFTTDLLVRLNPNQSKRKVSHAVSEYSMGKAWELNKLLDGGWHWRVSSRLHGTHTHVWWSADCLIPFPLIELASGHVQHQVLWHLEDSQMLLKQRPTEWGCQSVLSHRPTTSTQGISEIVVSVYAFHSDNPSSDRADIKIIF